MKDLLCSPKKSIDELFQERSVKRKNKISKEGKHLSYQQIADDSNLPCGVVKRVLKGDRGAKLTEAYALAEALGTTIDDLSDMTKESAIAQNHSELIEYLESMRNEVVGRMELLKSQLECLDQKLYAAKEAQTSLVR